MIAAKNLKDLLRIRGFHTNEAFFRTLPGCLGTAVGYKYNEREGSFEKDQNGELIPAILVFVQEKIPFASLDPKWAIPDTFHGPDGLVCASDVMVGSAPDRPLDIPALSGANATLQRALHEENLGVIGGIPIEAPSTVGTAGCVVTFASKPGGTRRDKLGVITNYHVAGFAGTRILNGGGKLSVLGTTARSVPYAPTTKDPGDLGSYLGGTDHRVDLGLVELNNAAAKECNAGVYGIRPLGAPYKLDIGTMGPIGTWVVSVGQALGRQEGRIMAYGYVWRNDLASTTWCATDYLILAASDEPFAAPGDSGKLVVTNDEHRQPIALLWGGERHDFWNVPAQASCAYATDIGLALNLLDAELIYTGSRNPSTAA